MVTETPVSEALINTMIPFDLTSLVQSWHDGSAPNYGVLLAARSGDSYGTGRFTSSDSAITALHPKLTLNYTCPCGVDCTIGTPPPPIPEGYLDEFNSLTCNAAADYIGSDGSLDWSPWAWNEATDDGLPCTGQLKIQEDQDGIEPGNNKVRFTGNAQALTREVDLSGFTAALLSFDYRRQNLTSGTREVSVEFR